MDIPINLHRRLAALMPMLALVATAAASTPAELLAGYGRGAAPDAARGQAFFNQRPAGRDWSCASCHGSVPLAPGRHVVTARDIAPLAPAANPQRFADAAKTEKWFRRNCNDVLGRECTAGEKADVLAWLLTLKR